ncbi:MAG TPA: efflux RND transporter periplasmic adaptor subunit [Polyangia bacterium]|nr:efflux RND transporter periplasmic adaptor subunit [Polyangia bacterium]
MSLQSQPEPIEAPQKTRRVSLVIAGCAAGALAVSFGMLLRAESRVSKTALVDKPRPVSIVTAKADRYRSARHYVGTLRPWIEANVGPQFISVYVDTVLVRPGAKVKRGEVLATLDCRNANTASAAVKSQAHAIEARQKALADESERQSKLLGGGFASANEVEQSLAQTAAESAQLDAQKAQLAHTSLEVNDCILRAPFDGEVGDRYFDPGAFVRPGTAIVSVVDRTTVRFVADVPESDFDVVAPETPVHIRVDATRKELDGVIARRAPRADADARTVRFEVDLPNPGQAIPVDTTGEVSIGVGEPRDVTAIPLDAAKVVNDKATVFVVDGDVAHARTVPQLGETGGTLYVDRQLPPGARVVTEGRALLRDGDRVAPGVDKLAQQELKTPPAAAVAR